MIQFTLPMPPTINHYFARRGKQTFLPAKVREYRKEVAEIVAAAGYTTLEGRITLFVAVHPRSRQRQDLDNRIKGAAGHADPCRRLADDEQIDDLQLLRRKIVKGGKVVVVITEKGGA